MGSPQSGATSELSRAGRAGSDALRINLFSFEQYTASDSFSGLELVQQWESQIGSDDWCIHLPDSRLSKDKDKDTNIAKKRKIISNDWWIHLIDTRLLSPFTFTA